jgi:hypothetical protein
MTQLGTHARTYWKAATGTRLTLSVWILLSSVRCTCAFQHSLCSYLCLYNTIRAPLEGLVLDCLESARCEVDFPLPASRVRSNKKRAKKAKNCSNRRYLFLLIKKKRKRKRKGGDERRKQGEKLRLVMRRFPVRLLVKVIFAARRRL